MNVPKPVHAAFALWIFALAAGVFETALTVGQHPLSEAAVPIAIRVVVTAVAVFIALRMRAGRNWARITLAIGLGVIGTLSLIVDPVTALVTGTVEAPSGAIEIAFTASRALHTVAVVAATGLMFHPAARGFFRRPARVLTSR